LSFDLTGYFHAQGTAAFYKSIVISFTAAPGQSHYHVPLLLSPFGYSTYRGS
jgi:5-hydroxyisourate hydrolase